jgi:diguanylate cyclase (GGDEF)-like protein
MVAIASRSTSPLAILLLDLDHFKQINDTYGHSSGDEALAMAAAALTSTIRASDFAARYGGEEFLVLLPDAGADAGILVAEKIRIALEQTLVPSVDRKMSASIGVAVFPDHGSDGQKLLRSADKAMYSAKRSGRNRVCLFDPQAVTLAIDEPRPGDEPNGSELS